MATLELVPAAIQTAQRFDGLVFREVRYAHDFEMPTHTHEEAHFFLCLTGTVQQDYRHESHVLPPATLAFLPEEEPHSTRFLDGVRTFDIMLKPAWVERRQQFAPLFARPIMHQNSPPAWTALRLYREYQKPDTLTPLMLEGLTLELLAQLARFSTDRTETQCPRWLEQARDFLHAHFRDSFSLEAVAAAVHIHPDHLTRAFRQQYHCTMGDYVRRLRVEYACHLLSRSDAPLSQIALDTGFADQSHFHRNFKSQVGITPTEYRKATGRADSRQSPLF